MTSALLRRYVSNNIIRDCDLSYLTLYLVDKRGNGRKEVFCLAHVGHRRKKEFEEEEFESIGYA